jgi:6-phosphogluconolactonase
MNRRGFLASVPFASLAGAFAAGKAAKGGEYIVYVGTNTHSKSKGIYAYRFQPSSGKVTPIGLVAETPNPSWLTVHPGLRYLYAVNEAELKREPGKPNNISSFALDRASGKLTFLNRASAGGQGPCYVSVDRTGKTLLLANYGSGSVAALPIQTDGRLGEATAFVQHKGATANARPRGHCILASPNNRFVLAADLGLDQVFVYRFDAAKGTLTPNDPPFAKIASGTGPRHIAFHPNKKLVYVVSEMGNIVTAFQYADSTGTLTDLGTVSTLPKDFTAKSTSAEIGVDRAGKFLYTSNRGHDSIAQFAIDPKKGTLTPVEHVPTQGKTPRNFALDPTGRYLFVANQDSNNIVVFRVDPGTGKLAPSGTVLDDAPEPTRVLFVPAM